MPNQLESRIRDYLADHLHLLGKGMVLLHKEHVLPNSFGASGRIDILARDQFGIFVIIEIKRSDQSARQALHEIHKYTALLRMQHGLDEKRVRIVIVSTKWNELCVPLSECVTTFPYSIEPVAIEALPDGTIKRAEKVRLLDKTGLLMISRAHFVFCFKSPTKRNGAVPSLINAISRAGIRDFAVLALDWDGNSPGVCFQHALYFFFSSPLLGVSLADSERIKADLHWDDDLDDPDDNFISAVLRTFDRIEDDSAVGYPEKLTTILAEWKTVEFYRHGRLAREHSLLSDDDVVRLATAVEGGSPLYICKMSSPKHSAHWKQLCNDVPRVLRGMPEWEVIGPLLKELENSLPEANVSIDIFNPCNLLMTLYPIVSMDDFAGCPTIEIAIENARDNCVRMVLGMYAWNGKSVKCEPKTLVEQVYGGIQEWLGAIHFHQTHHQESDIMTLHGLSAPVLELTYFPDRPPACVRLELYGKRILRLPFDLDTIKGIREFAQENAEYLARLRKFVDLHAFGMPGQNVEDLNRHIEEIKAQWQSRSTNGGTTDSRP